MNSYDKVDIIPTLNIYPNKVVWYNEYVGGSKRDKNTSGIQHQRFDEMTMSQLFQYIIDNGGNIEITEGMKLEEIYTYCKKLKHIKNVPEGELSYKGSARLRLAINWLSHLSKWQTVNYKGVLKQFKFKINFITLTLPSPQVIDYELPCGKKFTYDDYTAVAPAANAGFGKFHLCISDHRLKHDYFNQFLTEIRTKYKVKYYVWRAETQANGNVHFHLTLSKFIYWKDLRTIWNRILDKSDFIDRYQKKFKGLTFDEYCIIADPRHNKSFKKLLKAWEYGNSTDWRDPNTTDVHSVKNICNIEAYLSEYYCKKDESRRYVDGYLWRLSECLSAMKHATITCMDNILDEFEFFCKSFQDKFKKFDYSQVLFIGISQLFDVYHNSKIVERFERYRHEVLARIMPQLELSL